jgi:glyoxylase-like metal-dependent hydrolase (beta-lactamase superfamily II)
LLISELKIATLISSYFDQNAYIVHLKNSKDCFIVDAGFDADKIVNFLEENSYNPIAILVTHGHVDHIGGNKTIQKTWKDCKIYIGKDDAEKLTNPEKNLSQPFGFSITSPPADYLLKDGEKIIIAGIPITVLHIPGHSIGHVIFYIAGDDGNIVFVGDVIFCNSIGRTDFPDGNYNDLIEGIRHKILTLPGNTVLYPGHGQETTLERELRYNPYLQGDVC